MPRRRMIDPFFYTDPKVGKLSRDERNFIVGCVCQADDEGRLQGDPAFLKSQIFKYDKDLDETAVQKLRDSCFAKMKSWPANHPYRMVPYQNSDEEYIFFPNWAATNRPSHATKSQLPAPPPEALPIFSGKPPETVPPASREAPEASTKPSALGQSSLGQVSVGKYSAVREDFAKYLDSEKDLTDFLTTVLTEYMPRGPAHAMLRVGKLWYQATGQEMDDGTHQVLFMAMSRYPVAVLARTLAKGVKRSPGKTKPSRYIETVLKDQMKEYEKEHPP